MDKQKSGGLIGSDGDWWWVTGDGYGVLLDKMKLTCEEQQDTPSKSKDHEASKSFVCSQN